MTPSHEDRPSLDASLRAIEQLFRSGRPREATLRLIFEDTAAETLLEFLLERDKQFAAEAFVKLMKTLENRQGKDSDPIRNAEAYLSTVLRSVRTDRYRTVEVPSGFIDGEFADRVDEPIVPAANLIEEALLRAAAYGEHALVKFATSWLDLADELHRTPTSREAAQRLGVSHQTVINRLRSLGQFIKS